MKDSFDTSSSASGVSKIPKPFLSKALQVPPGFTLCLHLSDCLGHAWKVALTLGASANFELKVLGGEEADNRLRESILINFYHPHQCHSKGGVASLHKVKLARFVFPKLQFPCNLCQVDVQCYLMASCNHPKKDRTVIYHYFRWILLFYLFGADTKLA